ncbi:DUF6157 family protein [Nesterenkonia muleiensis]|uniref:DUF6157 family protein n=1 Tax=Nesterenkonia muleiensis TaxID=2282648 RepID=UPI000E758241|nr:DUF6157 family protein [Nesterenkonia muleiensis]
MTTTNYRETFIQVAVDCPVEQAEVPPARGASQTVAQQQYELIGNEPYAHTSDDVLFAVHAARKGLTENLDAEREALFAKPQACLRSSPLAKRYGWGIHHDARSRVALIPLGSDDYRRLSEDASIAQLTALRSRRG